MLSILGILFGLFILIRAGSSFKKLTPKNRTLFRRAYSLIMLGSLFMIVISTLELFHFPGYLFRITSLERSVILLLPLVIVSAMVYVEVRKLTGVVAIVKGREYRDKKWSRTKRVSFFIIIGFLTVTIIAMVSLAVLVRHYNHPALTYAPYDKDTFSRAVETQLEYPGMKVYWHEITPPDGVINYFEKYMLIGALPPGVSVHTYQEYIQSQIKGAPWKGSELQTSFQFGRGDWGDYPFAEFSVDSEILQMLLQPVTVHLGQEIKHEVMSPGEEEQMWLSKDGGLIVHVDVSIKAMDQFDPQPTSALHPITDLFPKFHR